MRNLILDKSVVIEACQNPNSNAPLFEALNSARKADVEIWIYVAEASAFANGEFTGHATRSPISKFCGLLRIQQYACCAPDGHEFKTFFFLLCFF